MASTETVSEEKLREIAEALVFLVIVRAIMKKLAQDNAPPSRCLCL